jgi:hypothetical protein
VNFPFTTYPSAFEATAQDRTNRRLSNTLAKSAAACRDSFQMPRECLLVIKKFAGGEVEPGLIVVLKASLIF